MKQYLSCELSKLVEAGGAHDVLDSLQQVGHIAHRVVQALDPVAHLL